MTGHDFILAEHRLTALGSGALWWEDRRLTVVSDLHLGRTERQARRGGSALPPYEIRDTLSRLEDVLNLLRPETVICLGDSFDDLASATALSREETQWLARLQEARRWIWIEGNHDPGPAGAGGEHLSELELAGITFRHIAQEDTTGEISGHYHPKARLAGRARPAFLIDGARVIMPAFGTFTGGLRSENPLLCRLMRPDALAVLTGAVARPIPMPRLTG